MTSRSYPPTDRKDGHPVIAGDQRQDACVTVDKVGSEMDGIMAVLFRLYACYLEWYARSRGVNCDIIDEFPQVFLAADQNRAPLKLRLFCTVPHEFHVAPRPDVPSATNLRIKSVRVPGTTRTQHFVLYPGARRDVTARKGLRVFTTRFIEQVCVAFGACVIKIKAVATCGVEIVCSAMSLDMSKTLYANDRFKPP